MTHQKRLAAPRSWTVPRKTSAWVLSPRPGPHAKERSMPLGLFLREVLRVAETRREARQMLLEGRVLVNGVPRKEVRLPVGFFDVLSLTAAGKHYVVVPDRRARLRLREIPAEQARTKLSRVTGKTVVKGGKVQLHLFDGTNLAAGGEFRSGDGLVLSLPDRKVVRHYPRKPGTRVFVAGGSRAGTLGTLQEVRTMRGSAPDVVRIAGVAGHEGTLETIEDYVFPVGPEEEKFLREETPRGN
ncbi:MAG: 30S ribosomal protein S4e [Halobacteria archaeon]